MEKDELIEYLLAGLSDAGCAETDIKTAERLISAGQTEELSNHLRMCRAALLDKMHESQRHVDRIDFLIRQTKKIFNIMKGNKLKLMIRKEELKLTKEWDKTFPKSDLVDHEKVTFVNRYGITLAADMYVPKHADGRLPAIAVSGPFGAVKEQCAGLYAQTMAERGFLTVAFDPSFTGESGGSVRYMASPDINTEDFMAAVDFLSLNESVDPDRIGVIGICGWGGMALNAAALDTRIKATVASTMYDMTRVNANGYFDSEDSEELRYQKKAAMCAQRLSDLRAGEYKLGGGVVDPLPEDAPFFVKDYYDYYKTPRGYHVRSLNSNGGWNVIGCESFMNQPILRYIGEIRSAVLIMHGEKAHSCYFSRDAYDAMTKNNPHKDNKELLIIPGAVHTDLYDGGGKGAIPFDRLEEFFAEYLK